jgi:lipopolysaccharide export system protein LptC
LIEKLWFVRCAIRKATSLTSARQRPRGEKKKKLTSETYNTYINKVDKKATTPYLIKKKNNGKKITIKANKQANKGKGGQTDLGVE